MRASIDNFYPFCVVVLPSPQINVRGLGINRSKEPTRNGQIKRLSKSALSLLELIVLETKRSLGYPQWPKCSGLGALSDEMSPPIQLRSWTALSDS